MQSSIEANYVRSFTTEFGEPCLHRDLIFEATHLHKILRQPLENKSPLSLCPAESNSGISVDPQHVVFFQHGTNHPMQEALKFMTEVVAICIT